MPGGKRLVAACIVLCLTQSIKRQVTVIESELQQSNRCAARAVASLVAGVSAIIRRRHLTRGVSTFTCDWWLDCHPAWVRSRIYRCFCAERNIEYEHARSSPIIPYDFSQQTNTILVRIFHIKSLHRLPSPKRIFCTPGCRKHRHTRCEFEAQRKRVCRHEQQG